MRVLSYLVMQARISLSSISYKDLKYLLCFFNKSSLLQENTSASVRQKVSKKAFTWTLLKSPHVNKSAREQLDKEKHHLVFSTKLENFRVFILLYKKALNCVSSNITIRFVFYTTGELRNNTNRRNINYKTIDYCCFLMINSDIQGERFLSSPCF